MKRFVNGVEVDLEVSSATIGEAQGRQWTQSAQFSQSSLKGRVGSEIHISFRGSVYRLGRPSLIRKTAGPHETHLHAPMPGLVVEVFVKEGDLVNTGDKLITIEAMKTLQTFTATHDGTVEDLRVSQNQQVSADEAMLRVVPAEPK